MRDPRSPLAPAAAAIVAGTAAYTLDTPTEGVLQLRLLRSPHAHARILSIDTRAALAVPGVRLVLTHADSPAQALLDRTPPEPRGQPGRHRPAR